MPMRKPHWHFFFMELESCFKIGWILKPHGLKGEVTILLEDDAPLDFSSIQSVFIEQNKRLVPYFIESVSAHVKKAFIKFEDVSSIEDAQKISKHEIYLPKALRAPSVRGDFYNDEVIDFEVHDEDNGLLGKIREVIQVGPNRLLAIDWNGKEVLIPVNGPFITSINKGKKRVSVSLPEGFLEI